MHAKPASKSRLLGKNPPQFVSNARAEQSREESSFSAYSPEICSRKKGIKQGKEKRPGKKCILFIFCPGKKLTDVFSPWCFPWTWPLMHFCHLNIIHIFQFHISFCLKDEFPLNKFASHRLALTKPRMLSTRGAFFKQKNLILGHCQLAACLNISMMI